MAHKPMAIEFEFRNKRYHDAEVGLRAFADHLAAGIHRAGPILSKEMRNYLDTVAEALATRHGGPWPGGTTPKTLSRRSGEAIKSIRQSVEVRGKKISEIEGEIGGVFYLRIQEFGGWIRPKKAKYLTIPLPTALNANGTPKKKSARDWDRTFVARSKKGNLLIFQRRGHTIVPLYVLKDKVYIPPRLGMGDTLRAGLPYFVDTAMDSMLKEFVHG